MATLEVPPFAQVLADHYYMRMAREVEANTTTKTEDQQDEDWARRGLNIDDLTSMENAYALDFLRGIMKVLLLPGDLCLKTLSLVWFETSWKGEKSMTPLMDGLIPKLSHVHTLNLGLICDGDILTTVGRHCERLVSLSLIKADVLVGWCRTLHAVCFIRDSL